MLALQTAAFATLAAVSLLRMRSALRTPRARLSWLASAIGALALLTLGSVIPLDVLDNALGGTNIIYLVQNILATLAFWLVTQATVAAEAAVSARPRRRYWPLCLILVAITFSFFLIQRGPTTPTFIHDHTAQLAAVLCASIYLAGISIISSQLIAAVRRRRAVAYWPFIVGGFLVVLASVNEILWLFLDHFNAVDARVQAAGYTAFDPLFYSGIILIVTGIASFTIRKWARDGRVTVAIRKLSRIIARAGVTKPALNSDVVDGADRLTAAYDLLIGIHDEQLAGRLKLSLREQHTVTAAEVLVTKELSASQSTASAGDRSMKTGAR